MIKYQRRWIEPERYLRRWLDPRLAAVKVADIRNYLLQHNWTAVPSDRPRTLVFREPAGSEGESLYQFVPESESDPDYFRRIVEFITLLAFFEDRHPSQILNDMLSPSGHANGAAVQAAQDVPAVR